MIDVLKALLGIALILGFAYLCSSDRKAINWRTTLGALAFQMLLGAFVLWIPIGQDVLMAISGGVTKVIGFSQQGINFLFGDIGEQKIGFIFAFHVLPIIIFFSALISVLYYLGIMGHIIRVFGGAIHWMLHTSRSESMSATANVFVGQIEAPLVIKPYLPRLTRSELFAVMVGGMASVSGSVLAGFSSIGVELQYLIAASFMAAPAGLLMAKMLVPEVAEPNDHVDVSEEVSQYCNIVDAASSGAISGLKLAANIGAVLLAFIGLIAMVNGILGWIGSWFGLPELSLQFLLGYVFQPVAYIIGIAWSEASTAGMLIGEKIIINEFVAYIDFVQLKDGLSEKTQVIITFALCGFANLGSIALLLGGLGSLAEGRRQDIAKFGLRAVFAGTLANLMSATIAGLFVSI